MNMVNVILMMLLPILQMSVKNPKSLAKERVLLTQIRDLLDQIIAGIPDPKLKSAKPRSSKSRK
jgi:hypothetical protein